MKQAAGIKDLELGGLLSGIKVNTSATDFAPLSQLQLVKFKGQTWERFGDIMSSDVAVNGLTRPYQLLKEKPLQLCRRGFLLSQRRQSAIEFRETKELSGQGSRDTDRRHF